MKKSTLIAVIGICLFLISYACLAYGVFLGEKNKVYMDLFIVFFLLGAVAFFGYLKAHNKEVRQTKRVLFLNR
jgi:hypothetical protein